MIEQSRWRKHAAPIIAKVLADTKDKPEAEIRKALTAAYPFGERKYHPYKIWLDEIGRQRGKKWPVGHKRKWSNERATQQSDYRKLAEWEAIYGKRTA